MCFKSYATKLVLHLTLIFGAFGCSTLTGRLGAFFAYLLFVYFQVSTGVLSFLDYSEDICLVALSDPPQTLNPNDLPYTLLLPLYSSRDLVNSSL